MSNKVNKTEKQNSEVDVNKQIISRLNRAKGQMSALIRMIEDGENCQDAVYLMAAVSKAVNNAGVMLITNNLEKCIAEGGSEQKAKTDKLKKLFLTIA